MYGTKAYQDCEVLTQNKSRLIILLYDGAMKFMKLAIKELEAKNYEAKGRYINKALDMINELNAIFDMSAGDEMTLNLRNLYCFMTKHLSEANIKRDPHRIRDVIQLMGELKENWKLICSSPAEWVFDLHFMINDL
ncbi:MAG: flagellar export chaperone FliS [Sedimentisphaerales bacterium]|nr:flagellar export chaperone FliS [Sedimentisphaerales bacterium]